MIHLLALPAFALLAGCSQAGDAPTPAETASPAVQSPTAVEQPGRAAGRAYRYTSLTGCKLVREENEEMPYTETLCEGPAGWMLRIADADARQTLAVIAPDKRETRIDLSRVSGGAFNSFGNTAEWRGALRRPFAPDSMVVRLSIAEEPHPSPEVAYLLAIRLAPGPCLIAKVAPGPRQNEAARAAADGERACAPDVR